LDQVKYRELTDSWWKKNVVRDTTLSYLCAVEFWQKT